MSKKYYIYGYVVIFLIIVAVFVFRCEKLNEEYDSGLKMALEEVRSEFGLDSIMWPPQTGKFEGLNYSENNGRILYDRCLTGDVEQDNVAESYNKSFKVNELAALTGQVGGKTGGTSAVKRSVEAQLILSGLYSKRISNLAPTFDEKCAAKDYFPSDPIFQYVLYAKEFRIQMNLDHDDRNRLSQDKNIRGIGGIDFNVKLVDSGDSTVFLTANDVAIGYKKATPSFVKKEYTVPCLIKKLCKFGDSEYSIFVNDISDKGLSAVVNNELFGLENESIQLNVGESYALRRFPAARDVIAIKHLDVEKNSAELRILILRWQVERGDEMGQEAKID